WDCCPVDYVPAAAEGRPAFEKSRFRVCWMKRQYDQAGDFSMTVTFASLGLGELSIDEKLNAVGQLWDELVASMPPGGMLTEGRRNELARRVADAAARPDEWVAWEEALAATLRRLSR